MSKFLFENYYDDKEIIRNLLNGIYPTSWSDKYSDVLEKRLDLAYELKSSINKSINEIGIQLELKLKKEINLRKVKEAEEQEKYNAFE